MLRVTAIFTLLLAMPALSFAAQNRAGVLLGTNVADLHSDPSADTSSEANFLFGGYGEFEVSEPFYVEAQLRYNEKGADVSNTFNASLGALDVSLTLKYLELPFYAKWKFLDAANTFRPFVFLGPNLGFKIGSSVVATSRSTGLTLTSAGVLGSSTKTIDLAVDGGVGGEAFITDIVSFRAQAAYSLGLIDIDESPSVLKTRGMQLYAALGFVF